MDPRLIELNPRIDDPAGRDDGRSTASLAQPAPRRFRGTTAGAALVARRRRVGRWLVELGTALERGSAPQPSSTAQR
jgi:hypothetical protein